MEILGIPLGWLMSLLYKLSNNYVVSILLLTLVTKLIFFPLAIKQQKSTALMNKIRPKQLELEKRYKNNRDKYQTELAKLQAEEGYSMSAGCLPALVQIALVFGIIDVVYKPLKYLLSISATTIDSAVNAAQKVLGDKAVQGWYKELAIINAFKQAPEEFKDLGVEFVEKVDGFSLTFFGMDIGKNPTLSFSDVLIWVPIISLITSFLVSYLTNKLNGGAAGGGQTASMMKGFMYIMPFFSAYISLQFPAAVGIYWIISNLATLLQVYILHLIYTPAYLEKVVARDKARRKASGKKTFMERVAEDAQKRSEQAKGPAASSKTETKENEDQKKPASQKELEKRRLARARQLDAEKYGEEYKE